jgi:hypothetical protein
VQVDERHTGDLTQTVPRHTTGRNNCILSD